MQIGAGTIGRPLAPTHGPPRPRRGLRCQLRASYLPDRITKNLYDNGGQLLTVQKAFATPLQQNYVTYTYTPNGKQKNVTDANGNKAELRYDGHDRQMRWVFPSKTSAGALNEADYEAYGYDAAGNRTSCASATARR